jgi:hypothetical protein
MNPGMAASLTDEAISYSANSGNRLGYADRGKPFPQNANANRQGLGPSYGRAIIGLPRRRRKRPMRDGLPGRIEQHGEDSQINRRQARLAEPT